MPENTQPAEQTTTAYHWVMTVSTPDGTFNTRSAIVELPGNCTRQQIYMFVLNQFQQDYGPAIAVHFFDLQPNQL
jgi:hypothetical protein